MITKAYFIVFAQSSMSKSLEMFFKKLHNNSRQNEIRLLKKCDKKSEKFHSSYTLSKQIPLHLMPLMILFLVKSVNLSFFTDNYPP